MLVYSYRVKICIIGDTQVGKTCILRQLMQSKFSLKEEPSNSVESGTTTMILLGMQVMNSISNVNEDTVFINTPDVNAKLQIYDIPTKPFFGEHNLQYLKGTACVLAVFDVTQRSSFETLETKLIYFKYVAKPITIAIVANKIDLEEQRVISREEAEQYATTNKYLYFECTAKVSDCVQNLFNEVSTNAIEAVRSGSAKAGVETGVIDVEGVWQLRNGQQKKKCC